MKTMFVSVAFGIALLSAGLVAKSNATSVGDIQAVYYAPNPFGISPTTDGPAFVFENTSTQNVTNAVFTIGVGGDNGTPDSFNVGTIPAGGYVVVIPGESDDGGSHTFFAFTGLPNDTSDNGPNSDSVPFSFTGLLGGVTSVSTGTFTPGATRRLSNDGTISINFLGNQDQPCFNCFGPVVVADINVQNMLQLTSVISRKTHGSAGDFDVDLPLTGSAGVECRTTSGNHTLIFTFSNNVVSGNAAVTSGTGTVSGSPVFSNNTMTVSLTSVTDQQQITVTISNVMDVFGQTLPDTSVNAVILAGDTNGNRTVNAADIAQTKSQLGAPVGQTNFRTDVNANGTINAADTAIVKSNLGHSVP
jgi:hypothetical protein